MRRTMRRTSIKIHDIKDALISGAEYADAALEKERVGDKKLNNPMLTKHIIGELYRDTLVDHVVFELSEELASKHKTEWVHGTSKVSRFFPKQICDFIEALEECLLKFLLETNTVENLKVTPIDFLKQLPSSLENLQFDEETKATFKKAFGRKIVWLRAPHCEACGAEPSLDAFLFNMKYSYRWGVTKDTVRNITTELVEKGQLIKLSNKKGYICKCCLDKLVSEHCDVIKVRVDIDITKVHSSDVKCGRNETI